MPDRHTDRQQNIVLLNLSKVKSLSWVTQFPISLSDTTWKATTSTAYPTFLKQDGLTPAPCSHLQMEKRSENKSLSFSISISTGLVGCWRPGHWLRISLKHRVVLAVNEAVDQRRRSSQALLIKVLSIISNLMMIKSSLPKSCWCLLFV